MTGQSSLQYLVEKERIQAMILDPVCCRVCVELFEALYGLTVWYKVFLHILYCVKPHIKDKSVEDDPGHTL